MVNVIIYLETKNDAEELVKHLLSIQLIASAAIDKDNISYAMNDGLLVKNVFNVITAKTKSLLINDIIKAVEDEIGEEVLIIATPIVGSNHNFDALVKQNTRPV